MKRVCAIGWPIEHTRSPIIHGYWLERHGIAGVYDKRGVPPEEIDGFLANLRGEGYVGANVTAPHKEAALRAAARSDAAAQSVGAANTLWYEDGELCASSTDTYGFVRNLDDCAPGWDRGGRPAVVLGAGGAARSVLRGLLDRGYREIRLANRSHDRAAELARFFGAGIEVVDWDRRSAALDGAGLLVNSTTVGRNDTALDLDMAGLAGDALVTDLVYVPLETPLLAQARERGLRTADGLGMLLHQAVPGFEKWFGVRPEVTTELREVVLRHIAGS
jgi:shikimate dehydrogenase